MWKMCEHIYAYIYMKSYKNTVYSERNMKLGEEATDANECVEEVGEKAADEMF